MMLTNWCWARRMNTRFSRNLSYCTVSLWASSWLNTSSSTASMLAVVCAVLGLPLPDFLVIDPVCFKCLIKLFNVLFCNPLAENSFVSVIVPRHLANYIFLSKLSPLSSNPSFRYLITSELSTASLSWQRLQLVLCHINNFYGKVSSFGGELLVSNINDTVRFF